MDETTDKVVIITDITNAFCRTGNLASERLDSVTPRIVQYAKREEAQGARLIFLVDTHTPDDPEFEMFPPHAVQGSGEDEVVPELAPLAERGIVVRKSHYSGFHETELDEVLARLKPRVVEVVGVCTDICVMHTVADLRNRHYDVVVHGDMVETYDAPGHAADEVNMFALSHMRDVLGAKID